HCTCPAPGTTTDTATLTGTCALGDNACTKAGSKCTDTAQVECCALVTLGDFMWDDLNQNGMQDSGEPGIPNVEVQVTDCSGNAITTVTTDANGLYQYTQTVCNSAGISVAISVATSQTALTGYQHTLVGVGSDTTDSDCGKGSNANMSQCT